ncbi:unnamed protein product [Schistosoma margrebowiei]|uniref:Uncharacterized protein n=1 Tax=Schistosoma margrebowiei TaxID=48269 RepID=A0A183MSC2_9TREM|nr:unnamed protein product [Schistosoma margrebowiei]
METLDPGFVLLGTRQQGVPVILRELVLPGGFDLVSPSFTVRDVTTELPLGFLLTTSNHHLKLRKGSRILTQKLSKNNPRYIKVLII